MKANGKVVSAAIFLMAAVLTFYDSALAARIEIMNRFDEKQDSKRYESTQHIHSDDSARISLNSQIRYTESTVII